MLFVFACTVSCLLFRALASISRSCMLLAESPKTICYSQCDGSASVSNSFEVLRTSVFSSFDPRRCNFLIRILHLDRQHNHGTMHCTATKNPTPERSKWMKPTDSNEIARTKIQNAIMSDGCGQTTPSTMPWLSSSNSYGTASVTHCNLEMSRFYAVFRESAYTGTKSFGCLDSQQNAKNVPHDAWCADASSFTECDYLFCKTPVLGNHQPSAEYRIRKKRRTPKLQTAAMVSRVVTHGKRLAGRISAVETGGRWPRTAYGCSTTFLSDVTKCHSNWAGWKGFCLFENRSSSRNLKFLF